MIISREEAKNLLVPQGMTSMRGYAIETAIDEIYDGVDEQTYCKLLVYKALYGCKTLSQAINKLMEKKNELC